MKGLEEEKVKIMISNSGPLIWHIELNRMNRDMRKSDGTTQQERDNHGLLDISGTTAEEVARTSKIDASTIPPDPWAVICGRGRRAFNHQGNKYLRSLVQKFREDFGNAKNRMERTTVVTNIIDAVRAKGVGFVKKDDDGRWVVIGDRLSREKVGQMMRETQGSKYRSSTKAKKRRQLEQNETISHNTQQVILSNATVAAFVAQVSEIISTMSPSTVDDDHLLEIMTQANCQILSAIKQDAPLLERFNAACNISTAATTTSGSDMDSSDDENESKTASAAASPTDEFDDFMKMTLE